MQSKLIILAMVLSSCEATEIPQPMKVTKLTKVYSIQVQQNGNTWNPQYLPNIGNGK
jgi:hypothetical protein